MNELITRLKSRANLSDDQAKKAANVVREFVDERLPDSLSGPVNQALTGENVQEAIGKAEGVLGGLRK